MISSVMTFSPTCWFVMAWVTPMGIMYMNAENGDVNASENHKQNHINAPMQRASTKPHTGTWVSHTSIETTPNTNMETEKDISTLKRIALITGTMNRISSGTTNRGPLCTRL